MTLNRKKTQDETDYSMRSKRNLEIGSFAPSFGTFVGAYCSAGFDNHDFPLGKIFNLFALPDYKLPITTYDKVIEELPNLEFEGREGAEFTNEEEAIECMKKGLIIIPTLDILATGKVLRGHDEFRTMLNGSMLDNKHEIEGFGTKVNDVDASHLYHTCSFVKSVGGYYHANFANDSIGFYNNNEHSFSTRPVFAVPQI